MEMDYPVALYPAQDWWPKSWAQAHTLKSAFQNSVVWFYQELASRMDREKVKASLIGWQYGNGDVSGGKTSYWLGETLAISPNEQVQFLQRFHRGQLRP